MQAADATKALHDAANSDGPLPAEAIEFMLANVSRMPVEEKLALLAELEALERKQMLKRARDDFLAFCLLVYPEFKEGPHHRHLKPLLHQVRDGSLLRVTVSMAPRFGKSISIAFLFVAWYLGHHPTHHIMMATHTASLSASFGRDVRNLISSPVYREIFPDTVVSTDKSAADNWTTTVGGKYLAIGIGANVAGHGAHLLVADDLVSEQSVLNGNPDAAFATAWEYMQVGPLQRLMPGGRIVMIGTRWGKKDPIGRALQWAEDNPGSIPWHEVRFPALMKVQRDGVETEVSLWPEQWPVDQLQAKRAGMQPQFWAAQYMQEPTSEEGALLKREWWRIWQPDKPPKVDFIIQSWDTAHETKNNNDYSACTTWGVWFDESDGKNKLILLNAFRARLEFPQLKKRVLEEYKEWQPECLLIEKKAAGAPLIQELRQMDIVVQEYSPSRGTLTVSNDKRARVNAVSDILFSGLIYAPDTRWAHEVIEECASFPSGDHDDLCDTAVMAWSRFRKGGFIMLDSDAKDDDDTWRLPRRAAYY